jgi:uncharacterized repeat protein (TIGR03803 family)
MTKLRTCRLSTFALVAPVLFVFCAATSVISPGQVTVTTLVNFDRDNGAAPELNVLTQGFDGNAYGTTYEGGEDSASGTVFKMTPSGSITTLYYFCSQANCADGLFPLGALVQAPNGDLYGTTQSGGAYVSQAAYGGTVFKITPTGKLTTLYSFCALANCADGQEVVGGLVQGRNGNFYGTTELGGAFGSGTVFEITPAGKLTTLHSFNDTDGAWPEGGLVQGTNGSFYGETVFGGTNNIGTIFGVTPEGSLTTLASFGGTVEVDPFGGLVQASNGDFYGVTVSGGSSNQGCINGCGTVFKVTPAGKLTTLYNFCSLSYCADGAAPFGPLVQGTDGNLYGTSSGANVNTGTIFEITPAGELTTLYTFCPDPNCFTGAYPLSGLLQATNGAFYGMTSAGGAGIVGTIFSMTNGLGPFVKTQPELAEEGAIIGVFGQGFNSSSVVQFEGVQATNIKLSGSTFLEATVPAGALTGSVTVTTDGTTLTSNQEFRVTPQLLSFNPPSGPVAAQVTITGTGFTQTLGVGFGDNMPAEFTVNSDTQITATVPTGAQTGPIGVETKGGTAISTATFTVN